MSNLNDDIVKRSKPILNRLRYAHTIADFLFNGVRFPGSRKLARAFSNIFLPALNSRISCPTIYDFDLVIGPENGQEIYRLGFYEPGTLNVIKHCLKEGDIFIDAGANIGLMTFFASKYVGATGKAIAFEPVSQNHADIENSIIINNSKNVIAIKKGLGDQKEAVPIYLDRGCPSIVMPGKEGGKTEIIEVDRLDNVLNSMGISKVSFIKIDVEGFELQVLKGAGDFLKSANSPVVCVEYIKNLMGPDETSISYLLKQNKYLLFQLSSKSKISKLRRVKEEKDLQDLDNVFCFTRENIDAVDKSIFE